MRAPRFHGRRHALGGLVMLSVAGCSNSLGSDMPASPDGNGNSGMTSAGTAGSGSTNTGGTNTGTAGSGGTNTGGAGTGGTTIAGTGGSGVDMRQAIDAVA